jgi:hypothetical protein
MIDRELIRRTLVALEWNLPVIEDYGDKEQLNRQHRAITALRAALEQPAQNEPKREWIGLTLVEILDSTHGLTRIQKDDWVATDADLIEFAHIIEAKLKEKNTLPQAREPLTDEQISRIWGSYLSRGLEFARAIEAAHGIKEKNT